MQTRMILYYWYVNIVMLLLFHNLAIEQLVQPDKPTLLKLLKFPPNCLSPHCINIASRIGKDYWKFGLFLLDDDDGRIVDAIAYNCRHDGIEMMTLKIAQKWIEGVGRKPVTWSTLVQVLYDIQLNQLAGEILKYTQPNTQLY